MSVNRSAQTEFSRIAPQPKSWCWRVVVLSCMLVVGLLTQVAHVEAAQPVDAAQKRPNIVFILADDLGWSDTTLYGHTKLYRTPNIQKLADRGLLFTQAYSASPLCSPTRSAILTGLSPARTGLTTPNCHLPQVVLQATVPAKAAPGLKSIQPTPVTRLKTEYPTLSQVLKDAGYATAHFGKWHLGPEPWSPLQQGFDLDLPHHSGPGPAGSYVAPWKFRDFDHDPDVPDQHIEDRMATEAAEWMEAHRDQPFFLNYWMFSVHAPFDAKAALIEKYRGIVRPVDAQKSPTYAAMIESMDDAVGTLMDTLDRLQLTDRTIVVFTSDNGGNMYSEVDGTYPTSNAPLRGGKASMFEGGVRVPCAVVWPGMTQPGTRSDSLVQSEDFFPTFLEGLKLSAELDTPLDGVSLLPALQGKPLQREAVFQFFPHNPPVPEWIPPSVSVHRGDWKLIRIFHGGHQAAHRWQLYNLREDLSETNNLADRHPALVRELDALITDFLQRTNAVVPIANPAFDESKYRPELEGKRQAITGAKRMAKQSPAGTAGRQNGKQNSDEFPGLLGWKPRGCEADISDGILQIKVPKAGSFLGFAAARHRGPATVTVRMKATPGSAKVDWLPGRVRSQPSSVPYATSGGDWQTITVKLPAKESLGIVRIYLPTSETSLQIDWIQITTQDHETRTDF